MPFYTGTGVPGTEDFQMEVKKKEFYIGQVIEFDNGQRLISAIIDNIVKEMQGMDFANFIYLKYDNGHVIKISEKELIQLM